jgi:Ca2+-binding EF-hand superfamily protein
VCRDTTLVPLQWFDTVDASRDGKIDAKELQSALQLGNLNFSLQAVAMMIRRATLPWNSET